ncbi:MAG: sigma-70 family RNA polymerase sigma factor [Candidatus Aminicenantia bacterium]
MKTKPRIPKAERISEGLKKYLREISKIPPLSVAEEKELWRRYKMEGDKEALKKIIESSLKFVVNYAKKFRGMGLSFEDLINEGNLAMIEAALRFDPSRNVRFISYAVWWIRQAIINAFARDKRVFSVPVKLATLFGKFSKKEEELSEILEREPTKEELARELKESPEKIEEIISVADESRQFNIDDEISFEPPFITEVSGDSDVEKTLMMESMNRLLKELLSNLNERESGVLKMRYGIDDGNPKTLQEISSALKISRERVRQIEKKAMEKLRENKKLSILRSYLN